jgi:hypothetical protein
MGTITAMTLMTSTKAELGSGASGKPSYSYGNIGDNTFRKGVSMMWAYKRITTGIAAGALLAAVSSGCAARQQPVEAPRDTWTAAAQRADSAASRAETAANRAEAAAARVEAAAKRAEDAAARVEAMVAKSMRK